jgi:hypothetical protein
MSANGRHRRGYLMIEMAITLGILAIASGVLGEATVLAFRVIAEESQARNRSARTDAVLGQLRSDIWQSRSAQAAPGGESLRVTLPDGAVRWEIEPDGSITRTVEQNTAGATTFPVAPGDATRTWEMTADHWTFHNWGGGVEVIDGSKGGGAVTLVSQLAVDRAEYP